MVRGIVRPALEVMENLPPTKIAGKFAGLQPMLGGLLARLRDVYESDKDAAWHQAKLGGFKHVTLQVVGDANQVPGLGLDAVLPTFQVRDSRINGQAAFSGAAK